MTVAGTPRIEALNVYPLKSAAGIAVQSAAVDEAGFELDRRWMVVDAERRFVSQRTHPRMALLGTEVIGATLRVTFPDRAPLELPLAEPGGAGETRRGARATPVRVWTLDRFGVDCGDGAAAWMSAALDGPCRILRAAPPADGIPVSADGKVRAGFADGFPALVVSQASLEDLNVRLANVGTGPLPMNRFRPNIVVSGLPPYGEDDWERVRAGDVVIHGVRPCPRCVTTTVDQASGTAVGPEPLRTLATYRRIVNGGAAFGMNVGFDGAGVLRIGDEIVTA